jgi:glyoxylase I family protein
MDAFKIKELDHVVLRVPDLERAVVFYTEILGCSVYRRQDALKFVQMYAGRSAIDLASTDGPIGKEGGPPPGRDRHNLDHLCLRVEPYDEAALVRYFESKSITPFDITKRYGADGYGPCMYIRDPFGTMIELKGPPEPPPQA